MLHSFKFGLNALYVKIKGIFTILTTTDDETLKTFNDETLIL